MIRMIDVCNENICACILIQRMRCVDVLYYCAVFWELREQVIDKMPAKNVTGYHWRDVYEN